MEQETQTALANHEHLYAALRSLPEAVLNASGRFLYSDASTLRPGRFYLLGYNPGGDPGKIATPLREEINAWGAKATNAYLDEVWRHSPEPGGSPYQQNVQVLFKAVGVCPRHVCASNLFFVRSLSAAVLKEKKEKIFWPVHEAVLNIVMPKCLLAVGLNTYSIIARLLGFRECTSFHSGHGAWYCRIAEGEHNGQPMKLIGFPHFSRYALRYHAEVLDWAAQECADLKGDADGNHP